MGNFVEVKASKMSLMKRKLVHGIGVNDADYITSMFDSNGKELKCPYYRKWLAIFERCYSPRFHVRQPCYKDCTVCEGWFLFSNFKRWMQNQDWQGKDLDKDIINYGNKIYSPDNCCFVERHVNNLILDNKLIRGKYPVGVTYHKRDGVYHARIKKCGKHIYLGSSSTPEGASNIYKIAKVNYILEITNTLTDQRVINGLKIHARLIFNE